MKPKYIMLVIGLWLSCTVAHANNLAQNTGGAFGNSANYFGQSFTVVGSGTYTNIAFNFYAYPSTSTPAAFGTGYLFSSVYSGTPSGLSSSDPGYLGMATASNGLYSFGSSVNLIAGTQYFFYEDTLIPADSLTGGNAYGSEHGYAIGSRTGPGFAQQGLSVDFDVTGAQIGTTPEPSSIALLATGFCGLITAMRKR